MGRMAAKRNEHHSRVSDPLAKAPHTTIELVTQHHGHGHALSSNGSSTATQKPRSLVEILVEDSLVAMPPGHNNGEHSRGSDKVRKKKKHGSRSRSRGHSPAPRSLSR